MDHDRLPQFYGVAHIWTILNLAGLAWVKDAGDYISIPSEGTLIRCRTGSNERCVTAAKGTIPQTKHQRLGKSFIIKRSPWKSLTALFSLHALVDTTVIQ
jgi:hypothetical protein